MAMETSGRVPVAGRSHNRAFSRKWSWFRGSSSQANRFGLNSSNGRSAQKSVRGRPSCILNAMLKFVFVVAAFTGVACSQDISRDMPWVSVDIRTPPVAPQTAGGYLLQYELYVTNWYDKDITIRAVDMLAGDVLVRRIEGEAIEHLFAVGSGQTAVVGPRQTTTIVLSGVVNDLPTKLDHRIR